MTDNYSSDERSKVVTFKSGDGEMLLVPDDISSGDEDDSPVYTEQTGATSFDGDDATDYDYTTAMDTTYTDGYTDDGGDAAYGTDAHTGTVDGTENTGYGTELAYTTADGDYTTVTGDDTTAYGDYTSANGGYTTTDGDYTTLTGDYTTADDDYTTADVDYTTANGDYTTADGGYTTADGDYATLTGDYTTADGDYTTADGDYTTADGGYTTEAGYADTTAYTGSHGTEYTGADRTDQGSSTNEPSSRYASATKTATKASGLLSSGGKSGASSRYGASKSDASRSLPDTTSERPSSRYAASKSTASRPLPGTASERPSSRYAASKSDASRSLPDTTSERPSSRYAASKSTASRPLPGTASEQPSSRYAASKSDASRSLPDTASERPSSRNAASRSATSHPLPNTASEQPSSRYDASRSVASRPLPANASERSTSRYGASGASSAQPSVNESKASSRFGQRRVGSVASFGDPYSGKVVLPWQKYSEPKLTSTINSLPVSSSASHTRNPSTAPSKSSRSFDDLGSEDLDSGSRRGGSYRSIEPESSPSESRVISPSSQRPSGSSRPRLSTSSVPMSSVSSSQQLPRNSVASYDLLNFNQGSDRNSFGEEGQVMRGALADAFPYRAFDQRQPPVRGDGRQLFDGYMRAPPDPLPWEAAQCLDGSKPCRGPLDRQIVENPLDHIYGDSGQYGAWMQGRLYEQSGELEAGDDEEWSDEGNDYDTSEAFPRPKVIVDPNMEPSYEWNYLEKNGQNAPMDAPMLDNGWRVSGGSSGRHANRSSALSSIPEEETSRCSSGHREGQEQSAQSTRQQSIVSSGDERSHQTLSVRSSVYDTWQEPPVHSSGDERSQRTPSVRSSLYEGVQQPPVRSSGDHGSQRTPSVRGSLYQGEQEPPVRSSGDERSQRTPSVRSSLYEGAQEPPVRSSGDHGSQRTSSVRSSVYDRGQEPPVRSSSDHGSQRTFSLRSSVYDWGQEPQVRSSGGERPQGKSLVRSSARWSGNDRSQRRPSVRSSVHDQWLAAPPYGMEQGGPQVREPSPIRARSRRTSEESRPGKQLISSTKESYPSMPQMVDPNNVRLCADPRHIHSAQCANSPIWDSAHRAESQHNSPQREIRHTPPRGKQRNVELARTGNSGPHTNIIVPQGTHILRMIFPPGTHIPNGSFVGGSGPPPIADPRSGRPPVVVVRQVIPRHAAHNQQYPPLTVQTRSSTLVPA